MQKRISVYFILMLVVTICVSISCDDSHKEAARRHVATRVQSRHYDFDNPPQFRHDDSLSFLDSADMHELLKIDIEVACTDEERARGLMFRPEMEADHGMLFLMGYEEIQSFYMRNTLIPLDIIYVDSKMQIVDIYANTAVMDETSLPSKLPAMYVVEVNAGTCENYGIGVGDFIHF